MGLKSLYVSTVCVPALVGCLPILTPLAFAQVATEPVVAHIALGWADPTRELGASFEAGWLVSGGATFHPDSAVPVGLRIDLGYGRFSALHQSIVSLPSASVTTVDDGYTSMGNLSLDAIYDFGGKGHIGSYVGAGIGGYSRYQTVTKSIVTNPGNCDPLVQVCTPITTVSKVSDRLTKIGYDVSVALAFPLHSGSQVYIEGRYHWMRAEPAMGYLPISVGYRW